MSRLLPLLALVCVLAGWVESAAAGLPLGPRGLYERRASEVVAPGVKWTRIVRGRAWPGGVLGPWRVHVLRIGRGAGGARTVAALSNGIVPGRERLTVMARRAGALAAVNGGFFGSSGALEGDPVGALALGGRLVSEPVAGRAALLVPFDPAARARVASLRFAGAVEIGGRRRLLDGVDRARGLVPACGGRGGDRPGERPDSARVCRDPSELVLLSPYFGARTRTGGGGVEAVVRGGVVSAVGERESSPIPADGYVLSGSGDAADFLREAAQPGTSPVVRLDLRSKGRRLAPDRYEAIVGGGPRLLERGRVRIRAAAEGFPPAFSGLRHPRTLAGVRADGSLLLVAVDGRRAGHSVGVTLLEAALLMRSLGAREALNLDGGGSTTMTIGFRVVNRPSDGRQRPLSDALLVVPR